MKLIFTNLPMSLQHYIRVMRFKIILITTLLRRQPDLISVQSVPRLNKITNGPLTSSSDIKASTDFITSLNLPLHNDNSKNWDASLAFSFIINQGNKDCRILDAGSAYYGMILLWLRAYGFKNLNGCDLVYQKPYEANNIVFENRDIHHTEYKSNHFDFVTCLSVIEHGVHLEGYLQEMYRLLKPGGFLITSTDYWTEKIQTSGIYPYGKAFGEMKIFTPEDIRDLICMANTIVFSLVDDITYETSIPIVKWDRIGLSYTYMFFILQKPFQ